MRPSPQRDPNATRDGSGKAAKREDMVLNTAREALRSRLMPLALTVGFAFGAASAGAQAQGTLRIAMTATDVPITTGAPDNGFEGIRFVGYPAFESLVLWDLSRDDRLADIRPGLAERWEQDANDPTKWIFHLRRGVTFHDGSAFNADAAMWNLDRYHKADAPQFEPPARPGAARIPFIAGTQDRRLHDRDHHAAAAQLLPEPAALHAVLQPGAVRAGRVLGGIRQGAVRHRPVPDHRAQAAHQRDAAAH